MEGEERGDITWNPACELIFSELFSQKNNSCHNILTLEQKYHKNHVPAFCEM